MSTHSVDVIRIENVLEHPNADKMEIVQIGEYFCCVGKGSFKPGDLGIFVEPDYIVNTENPLFNFLSEEPRLIRIKTKKLRGCMSYGLLIPCPAGFSEGENVMGPLGIERYEPEMKIKFRTDGEKAPNVEHVTYDMENWRKHPNIIESGEEIVCSEKIHGANARFVFSEGKMHLGSRRMWVKDDGTNPYSRALSQNSWIRAWCEENHDHVLYGEIFGQVQDLRYGTQKNQILFAVFDILHEGKWFDFLDLNDIVRPPEEIELGRDVVGVPVVYIGEYSKEKINELTDGKSLISGANHMREGIVIKPIKERVHHHHGRVIFKSVSGEYLSRSK